MLEHFDKFAYIYTFCLIVLITILINIFRQKKFIIKHRNKIAYFFALAQLVLYIYVTIDRFMKIKSIWHGSLMHDLCQMLSFFSIVVFILNNNKLYKAVMPWLLIGSTMTMLTAEAPIFSTPLWLTSYTEHTLMFMQGILAYFWVDKYTRKELLSILIFPGFLMIWLIFTGWIPLLVTGDERWGIFSTGLLWPALKPGEAFSILGSVGIPYPLGTLIFYVLAVMIAMIIALNKQYQPIYKDKIINWLKTKSKTKSKTTEQKSLK